MSLSTVFDSLTAQADGYRVTVGDDWTQGRTAFGGMIAAVGNEAMRRIVPRDRPLRSLTTTFVAPAPAGTWRIAARVLRVGKAVTVAQCEIYDGEQVVATQVGVYGGDRPSAVDVKPVAAESPRRIEDINEVRFRGDATFAFMQHFALRWAQGHKPFSSSPNAPTMAFVRHRDPAPLTESHVVALVDCIPTPAMSMFKAPAPASSLVWTLEFFEHRFDVSHEAWWRIDTSVEAGTGGYVNQTGVLVHPDGKPVALTRQLFAVFG